jgi:hypothetical protein
MTGGCGESRTGSPGGDEMKPNRSIVEVLNDHSQELMSVEGVVGIYAGLTGEGTPCLVVMAKEETPILKRTIPAKIEGYPVRMEYGGEIRPLK